MIKIGKYNRLKVARKKEYGYFLESLDTVFQREDEDMENSISDSDGKFSRESRKYVERKREEKVDVLLPNKNITDEGPDIGDIINVFVYRDSHRRLVGTMQKPKAQAGELAMLKVADNTDIGSFVDIGIERDVLVPFREKKYPLLVDEEYMFYIYVDKSGRLAATTDIEPHLTREHELKVGDVCNAYVYGFQTNKTAKVCVNNDIEGIILRDEYYVDLKEGDRLEDLKVVKIYEDGRVGLTARGGRKEEIDSLEKRILSYMEGNDGYMRFNDKSDPEELRTVFNTSKKNFKRTLGNMMKKGIITQDSDGCHIK